MAEYHIEIDRRWFNNVYNIRGYLIFSNKGYPFIHNLFILLHREQ